VKTVLRPLPEGTSGKPALTVCVNDRGANAIIRSCGANGAEEIRTALADAISQAGIEMDLQTIRCLGLCEKGPNVRLAPGNNWFHDVTPADAPELVRQAALHMGLG